MQPLSNPGLFPDSAHASLCDASPSKDAFHASHLVCGAWVLPRRSARSDASSPISAVLSFPPRLASPDELVLIRRALVKFDGGGDPFVLVPYGTSIVTCGVSSCLSC